MKNALLMTGIIECLGCLVLFFYPTVFFLVDFTHETSLLLKMYSLLGTCFGCIIIVLSQFFEHDKPFKIIYLILMAFQIFISFHLFSMYKSGFQSHMGPVATHIGLCIILFLGYFKDIDKYS